MYEAKENLFNEDSIVPKKVTKNTKSSNDVQEYFNKVEEENEFDFLSDED